MLRKHPHATKSLENIANPFFSPTRFQEVTDQQTYPGSQADPLQVFELAEAYYDAAISLFAASTKGQELRYAPARLCSIHAIELYLNAYLRNAGEPPEQVRARLHNLADERFVAELKLRKKTAEHLQAMTERREYLISRYAPELTSQHTELNRLQATLEKVRKKTAAKLADE